MSTIKFHYEGLHTVISGGQTGSDQAGVFMGKVYGLKTGGSIPRGFRTALGNMPQLAEFGLVEHQSLDYPPRTKNNAEAGDATVRLASNFKTAGERLTLKYANAAKKPVFDVLLDGNDYQEKGRALAEFIEANAIRVLNVAGNADRDVQFGHHFKDAGIVLGIAFEALKKKNLLVKA